MLFAHSSFGADGVSITEPSALISAQFGDKAVNEGISFVEIDGDLKARYKDKYGAHVQLSLKDHLREMFKTAVDYPAANFVRPRIRVDLQGGCVFYC
jgi:hypothetical protein